MKKTLKIFILFVTIIILKSNCNSVFGDAFVRINGLQISYTKNSGSPYFSESQTLYIPVRIVLENLGAAIEWNKERKIALIYQDSNVVKIEVTENKISINNNFIEVSSDIILKNNRIYISSQIMYELLELLGCDVDCYYENSIYNLNIYSYDNNEHEYKNLIEYKKAKSLDSYYDKLWEDTIAVLLSQKVWNERDSYDFGNSVIPLLYYAFESENDKYFTQFYNHFQYFLENVKNNDSSYDYPNILGKYSYWYIASQYMLLCEIYNQQDMIPQGLYEFIYNESKSEFLKEFNLWNYNFSNMEERMLFIMGKKEANQINKTVYSYDSFISDGQNFLTAILCDLYSISKFDERYSQYSKQLRYIPDLVYELYKNQIEYTDKGGWVLQKGVAKDYKDYMYANYTEISDNMAPQIIEDICIDVSHFERYPGWLRSYMYASVGNNKYLYFEDLIKKLGNQLKQYVIVEPIDEVKYYRVTNYMDGRNGLFRYDYHNNKSAYLPYQLSSSYIFGWWSLLEDEYISYSLKYMINLFPLNEEGTSIYLNKGTIRVRNPIYTVNETFNETIYQLLLKVNSVIGE